MVKGIPIRAISRSLAVLQAVNRGGALYMNDIAEASDIPYPTACRIVQTLVHEGMLEREYNHRRYRVTARVRSLSYGFEDTSRLGTVSEPRIAELTKEMLWPVLVASRVGGVMIVRGSTTHLTSLSFTHYRLGHTMPLLFSTSGRVYVAFCPEDERRTILKGLKLSSPAMAGYIDHSEFGQVLETIRQKGFAVQKYNHIAPATGKIASLSAPIFDQGRCLGALTMIFFATAMSTEEAVRRYADAIKAGAAAIGRDLAADAAVGY